MTFEAKFSIGKVVIGLAGAALGYYFQSPLGFIAALLAGNGLFSLIGVNSCCGKEACILPKKKTSN